MSETLQKLGIKYWIDALNCKINFSMTLNELNEIIHTSALNKE